MRILFLSAWLPYPPNNGSKLRVYNLLKVLSQRHEVTLLTLTDEPNITPPPELLAICAKVHAVPRRRYNPRGARALLGLARGAPRSIVDTHVPCMAELIHQELGSGRYDVVIASQLATAVYLPARNHPPTVLEELELGIFEAKRANAPTPLHKLRHQLTLLKLRFYLQHLLPRFAVCTVVSRAEAVLLQRLAPGYHPVEVVPNCVDLTYYQNIHAAAQPNTLIFTGSFRYFANYDAMGWFLEEVYPHVRAKIPDVNLSITGDHANLPLPLAENVTLTGLVDDVRPLVASAWISLAPIRLGGGTRLKILEAMALHTPVVATSRGAEGLDVNDGEHLLLADTPTDYANAVIRLLKDTELRLRLTENAHRLVRERYNWETAAPRFTNLVERAVHS